MNRQDHPDLQDRVARLTPGQRECLQLVNDHATSKEIARQLGISRHTVDMRLRGAIQTLGVSSRREAAIVFRAATQAEPDINPYQPSSYQASHVDGDASPSPEAVQELTPGRHGEEPLTWYGEDRLEDAQEAEPAPFFTRPSAARPPQQEPAMLADAAVWQSVPFAPERAGPVAGARLWGGTNDLNTMQRVGAILVIAIGAMLAFGMLLSGIQALAQLRS